MKNPLGLGNFPCLVVAVAAVTVLAAGCGDKIESTPGPSPRLARQPVTMKKLTYPTTATVIQTDDYHGTDVDDPYRWLEAVDSEQTRAWITSQNEVTFDFLASIPARQTYADRLTDIWNYAKYSAPFREGGRTFFYKNDGLQNQYVLYVQDAPDAEARILLDPNQLSTDGTVALGGISISRDGKYLAWSSSTSGSDWHEWHVRDIATATDLTDRIEWSKFSGASWDHNANGFYYSRYDTPAEGGAFDGANYFQKLYYHRVGTPQSEDRLVYDRPDQKEWGFSGTVSEDGRYLVITVWQGTSHNNRIFYQDLHDKSSVVRELLNKNDADYTFVGNEGPVFFFQTDQGAPRKRIIAVDLHDPEPASWRELVPESADTIDDVSLLDHGFVVTYLHDVRHVVKVYGLDGSFRCDIDLPGLGTVGRFSGRPGDSETWFTFTGFLNPTETHHYDFRSRQATLVRKPDIAFDFDSYTTEQVFYTSHDGTRIPMFIVRRKDLPLTGNQPTILYGYGGFNISLKPDFSVALLPWLEQGGVYAVANLRGGGEYGEAWHQAGMLKLKQNVFDDFIAAAEYLIAGRYTNPNRLAVYGGSNGGLLVGAVVNQRPELFGAAIPAVGVMDMLRYQGFTIGWAWTSDYGSSDDPEMFDTLYAYSPYHNLKPGTHFPAVMVMTADHDDRVVPGHSFKYAARLQACQAGNNPVLIRIQTKAGHGAGKPTTMVIQEVADRYAFLHRVLGLDECPADLAAEFMAADRQFAAEVAAAAPADRAEIWASWFTDDGRQLIPGAVVQGQPAIMEMMGSAFTAPDYSLVWAPDQAGGATGGDVGWTSGRYRNTRRGETEPIAAEGRYLTIWRRQDDGSLKVELDTGIPDE